MRQEEKNGIEEGRKRRQGLLVHCKLSQEVCRRRVFSRKLLVLQLPPPTFPEAAGFTSQTQAEDSPESRASPRPPG